MISQSQVETLNRPAFSGPQTLSFGLLGLGLAILPVLLPAPLRAEEGPQMRQVMQQYNRPLRAEPTPAARTFFSQPSPRGLIPTIFQSPAPRQDSRALGFAPVYTAPYPTRAPIDRPSQSGGFFPGGPASSGPAINAPAKRQTDSRPRSRDVSTPASSLPGWTGEGKGLNVAVNYCVRLCDGYAFPVGYANSGQQDAQEAACQLACPNAEVAMFTAPVGATDIDQAIRNGRPYSSIPNAFKYRTAKYDAGCTCRAPGSTTATAALMTDFTMRPGDLAMTRVGMRHFDGSQRFPYRANSFSDALAKLKDKKEIAVVRGMEAASLRGVITVNASANVRARVVAEISQAERVAAREQPRNIIRVQRGFQEVKPATMGPYPVRVVNRPTRFVAMN
jgi:Protein of unknown function (DUF2865)